MEFNEKTGRTVLISAEYGQTSVLINLVICDPLSPFIPLSLHFPKCAPSQPP